ncbi:MAG: hypothetical protein P8R42_06485 [Candidatus Binatia bacterium]|nr:hypothetical protein [Candidatus Binatia bacterium]
MSSRKFGLVLLALTLVACGPAVTVKRVSPHDVYQGDSASILETGETTRFSSIELHLAGISEEKARRDMLIKMHKRAVVDGYRGPLLALAELAYLEGQRTERQTEYLGAAVYAYLYLFGDLEGAKPTAWDPRTRIAADIYNRALARAFSTDDGDHFLLESGTRRLPVGQIAITVPVSTIQWEDNVLFETFQPADIYEVDGLAARYRQPGLGAPLIGTRTLRLGEKGLYPPELDIPATAFLRVDGGLEQLRTGTLHGTLELYDPLATPTISVAGQVIPLEAQTTTAYAYLLGSSPVWDFELAGFLSGADETIPPGISLAEPYRPDAIPVVLVHGTASSPARWAGLFNDLNNDPTIQKYFQFWFFTYNSGNPIAYSAAKLRKAIGETLHELDPDGDDPAIRDMVLIGHSQGGLLVRGAIADSTELDWKSLGIQPPGELELEPDERATLEEMMIFSPTPGVKRAVFVATPHKGSFVAGGIFGQIGAGLVSVSKTVLKIPIQAVSVPLELATKGTVAFNESEVPNAVNNMAPDSRFNRVLQAIPMAAHVPRHSIIAVAGDGPVEEGNDGVVEYKSAHLEEVESEVVVKSSHSVQSNPATVREVRRILLEHLKASGEEKTAAGSARALKVHVTRSAESNMASAIAPAWARLVG